MPRGDGTGPMNRGPQTGRGMGRCNRTTPFMAPSSTRQFSQRRVLPLISRILRFWQSRSQRSGSVRGSNRR